jgi:chromosome segregation ATPase
MKKRIDLRNTSLFAVRRAFGMLQDQIEELKEEIAELKGGVSTASEDQPEVPDEVEDVDELREQAKQLKVKSWHVMGADKLKEAIEEKLNENEGA